MTAFVLRVLEYGTAFILGFCVIAVVLIAVVFILSEGIQLLGLVLGYEVGNLFEWLIGGIARKLGWKKKKRKVKTE